MYTVPYRIPSGQWKQTITLSCVNSMSTWIVFYYQASAVERRMIRSLESGGMKVLLARTIASLHNLLAEKPVSVVVVPHSILKKYHIRARKHLEEARSTLTVICWIQRESGVIATHGISNRKKSLNADIAGINHIQARKASLLLRAAGSCTTEYPDQVSDCAPQYATYFPLPELPGMHKKMRRILECIAAAGESGTSPEHIVHQIWPEGDRDRIHDLQSYISKLRGILSKHHRQPVQIQYRKRKYRLVSGG